ncbi:hypothetical protein AYO39_01440 [Actinobacteria bacterium SCGC AG-212-D09]|nr:hypothetical protein AYO39_01440 [Actinobacteria bacterium SCGC AG-212-D09]
MIEKAQRETKFVGRAAHVDSTAAQAHICDPSDATMAPHGARALTRGGRGRQKLIDSRCGCDRSRSIGKTVRAI